MSARSEQVRKLLEKTPGDAFLLYAMALELKKEGALGEALEYLSRTLAVDADYLYAYYQQGQILEQRDGAGDVEAAKAAYDAGVIRARAKGDQKALGELQLARNMLG